MGLLILIQRMIPGIIRRNRVIINGTGGAFQEVGHESIGTTLSGVLVGMICQNLAASAGLTKVDHPLNSSSSVKRLRRSKLSVMIF